MLVVDEEIYRLLPALLIATVDKFAQLPWKGATQMLFGQVDKYCDRHGFRSPDLEDSDWHPKVGNLPRAYRTPRPKAPAHSMQGSVRRFFVRELDNLQFQWYPFV